MEANTCYERIGKELGKSATYLNRTQRIQSVIFRLQVLKVRPCGYFSIDTFGPETNGHQSYSERVPGIFDWLNTIARSTTFDTSNCQRTKIRSLTAAPYASTRSPVFSPLPRF